MPRFLHTADWQVGKPFRSITDPQKRYRVQQERILTIERIANVANSENVDVVLVAGDLFDSSTLPSDSVMEVLEEIRKVNKKVIVIPGNHDHGGSGGIWRREDVKEEIKNRTPLLEILLDPAPVHIGNAVILPCPLVRQHESIDCTHWITKLDWKTINDDLPRIVLAHGSICGFTSKDYDGVYKNTKKRVNGIDLDKLPMCEIDYIALGDWHNLKQINNKAWYSGTPEPDRFSVHKNENRGQVLIVDVERDKLPEVVVKDTASLNWHNISEVLNTSMDIELLEKKLDKLLENRVNKDLLKIEISGSLSIREHDLLKRILDNLQKKLLHLDVKGECSKRPKKDELKELTNRSGDPIISSIAQRLVREINEIEKLSEKTSEQKEKYQIVELALCELYRLCDEEIKEGI